MAEIEVVWLSSQTNPESDAPWESWSGTVHNVRSPTPRLVYEIVSNRLAASTARAWLFWDTALGRPEPERIASTLKKPGDVWHAGLRLGLGGLPGIMDFLRPTWTFNRDPEPQDEATSWRLSLRCCLIRTEVLQQMGSLRPEYTSLEGAGLEMGHRYLTNGVVVRHVPSLLGSAAQLPDPEVALDDEIRFALQRFGRGWCTWALARAVTTRYRKGRSVWPAWRRARRSPITADGAPFEHGEAPAETVPTKTVATADQVSVLIPTLDRYSYLRTLLEQLSTQTTPAGEVIVVDQTPVERRDDSLPADFKNLPLQVLTLDRPGQCSSRNLGLQRACGDFILFLDDDDEIEPSLIEAHLSSLARFRAHVSCGVATEVGAGPVPPAFRIARASDVFPTNNALLEKSVLHRSGLFDLAYERSSRADGDLGMRLYLSGANMMLDPTITVLHHHASQGGLRAHGARVVTYASSRSRIFHRHLPSVSEIYLERRYFSTRQVRESLWARVAGTFSMRGPRARRILKVLFAAVVLPHSLWTIRRRFREASRRLERFPQIPLLSPPEGPESDAEDSSSRFHASSKTANRDSR